MSADMVGALLASRGIAPHHDLIRNASQLVTSDSTGARDDVRHEHQ
jgi:hypothetical protein